LLIATKNSKQYLNLLEKNIKSEKFNNGCRASCFYLPCSGAEITGAIMKRWS